jgi:hypothetical protein
MLKAIAETAWLMIQYEHVRAQCAKQWKFLTRKEFMEKPGFMVGLTPTGLLAVIKAGIPFVSMVLQQGQLPSADLLNGAARLRN